MHPDEDKLTLEIPKGETLLLLSILNGDRKKPSKARARQRRLIFDAFCHAYSVQTTDEILETEQPKTAAELHDLITVQLSKATCAAMLDFANEALEEKDEQERAVLNGAQSDRILSLIDRLEDLRT
jgi:hypothetical protein